MAQWAVMMQITSMPLKNGSRSSDSAEVDMGLKVEPESELEGDWKAAFWSEPWAKKQPASEVGGAVGRGSMHAVVLD